MGLYYVHLSMSLLGFGMGTMLEIQLPYVWYYLVFNSSFTMLVRNASQRGHMCFRCLMFILSGPCELLFLLCLLPLGPELW